MNGITSLDADSFGTSILVRELGGTDLAARNPDVPLPPASNTKLLTTALALHYLTPDYRFETHVTSVENSLVLSGRGNPSLSREELMTLADAVRDAGIDSVTDIVADVAWFDGESRGPGWMWEDGQYGYGAESTPLALDRNLVSVTMSGTDVELTPNTDEIEYATKFDESADELLVFRELTTGTIRVGGKPTDAPQTESVPVGNPVRHCLLAFRDALETAEVAHTGELGVARNQTSSEPIAAVKSPSVADLVREMNVPSDNFLAEGLARTVAHDVRGEGSWGAWETVVREFLEERGADKFRIRDGSGLSRYNLISARGMVETLEWVADRPWSEVFFDSLPTAGEGTLETRFSDMESEIRAKTGTLTGSRTLSGIVRREGEPDVVFSVLLGGLVGEDEENARDRIDEFVCELVD